MRLRPPSPAEWIVAACCGLWVGVALSATGWALPAAAVSAALVLIVRQHPLPAAAGLAALQAVLAVAGLAAANGGGVAPFIVAVYALGRYAPLWPSLVVALGFPATALLEPSDAATIAFAIVLTSAVLAYGRVVRLRADRAARSRRMAAALQSTDAATEAARVVADERARLGGRALAVLREAVASMRAEAALARGGLDVDRIDAVAERGRQAVTELRWLLGLLRSGVADEPSRERRVRRIPVADAGCAALLLAAAAFELATTAAGRSAPAWALATALALCVVLRARATELAVGLAAVAMAAAALVEVPLTVAALIAVLLLAWSAAVRGEALGWALLAGLAAATMTWVWRHEPQNAPLVVALLALSAFAAHEWSAHDRLDRLAAERVDRLQDSLRAEVDAARQAERLRIARELHDVASHAIGAMVLQASAARALCERDPAGARDALGTIEATAQQALVELTMLFDLLQAGAIGAPGLAAEQHDPVEAVLARHRRAGLDIRSDLAPIPARFETTVHRIVQESLTNVLRHSDARHVRVTATIDGGTLEVRVADDGRATADRVVPGEAGEGFGLRGLAERVEALGGRFRAEAGAAGFTVEAALPIDAAVRP